MDKKKTTKIALDAMSGDLGPEIVVEAAYAALKHYPDLELILVGDEASLVDLVSRGPEKHADRLSIHHSSEVVMMDESPAKALRQKKDSSMRVAINLVHKHEADACVSAGNTGALMSMAKFVLKTIPGLDRPAIMSAIPTMTGHTHMLDLGANAECSAEQLFQFGVMGSVLVSAVNDIESPRVGLLNIGEEEIKGIDRIKEAGRLLADSPINYIGYVEGNDIYSGVVDVVVSDGFVGNVALKTSEGLASMVSHYIKEGFTSSWYSRLAALIAMPVLSSLKKRMDPRSYNGASLAGLRGIVVKSHGGADALAFENAIRIAMLETEKSVPEKIDHLFESIFSATNGEEN